MAKTAHPPAPMEAVLAAELPEGEGWQYEPKWDGFRALARRDGDDVTLTSRSGKPLGRYFPEVLDMLRALKRAAFPARRRADHPGRRRLVVRSAADAASPGRKPGPKARRRDPGRADGCSTCSSSAANRLLDQPLSKRRKALERFYAKNKVRRPAPVARDNETRTRRSAGCVAAAAPSTESSPSGSTSNTGLASGR